MKGNIGTAFALGMIVGVINLLLGAISNLAPYPISFVLAAVLGGVTTLLSTCSLVIFYFSCRCKLENFDLELLADDIGRMDEVPGDEGDEGNRLNSDE